MVEDGRVGQQAQVVLDNDLFPSHSTWVRTRQQVVSNSVCRLMLVEYLTRRLLCEGSLPSSVIASHRFLYAKSGRWLPCSPPLGAANVNYWCDTSSVTRGAVR